MYAMILEFKAKTIMIKDITTNEIHYLYPNINNIQERPNHFISEEGLEKGDILEVEHPNTSRLYGKSFERGHYTILNDGKKVFENCLKCGQTHSIKKNPLCPHCWDQIHNEEIYHIKLNDDKIMEQKEQYIGDRTKKEYNKLRNKNFLSFSKLDVREKIIVKRAIKNITDLKEIADEVEKFSNADVLGGLSSLEENLDTVTRTGLHMDMESLENIDKDYFKSPEIKGLLFEIATYKLLDKMKGKDFGIKAVKPSYKKHLLKYEDFFDYQADGEIQFNTQNNGDVWAIYDCKAYGKGYDIKSHLAKIKDYLRIKQGNSRVKRNYKYAIVISNKFIGNIDYHSQQKFSDLDRSEMKFILISAKQLWKIYDQQRKELWLQQNFFNEFPWDNILGTPGDGSAIHLVSDNEIDRAIVISEKILDD